MTPPITLNIYQKPAIGSAFIRRHVVTNYRHKISAYGGFDTASCDIPMTFGQAERFLEQMIGNRVAAYASNPIEPIWEGLISRITFEYGPIVYTASLEEMANRVRSTFSDGTGAAAAMQQTAVSNNTDSRAIYGIKEVSMDMGVYPGTPSATTGDKALRNLTLAARAWPQASTAFQGSAGQALVHVECIGFYQTLDWSIYQQTTITQVAPSTLIATVIGGDANGTTFYDNTDTALIASNGGGFTFQQSNRSGMGRGQFIQQIIEMGDGTNLWVWGVTPTDFNTGKRRFYYRQAAPTVKYTTRLREGAGQIRNLYGKVISPWEVRPDAGIRVNDALVAWDLQGDDPRVVFMQSVDYDAERGQVSYQSADDLTVEGVFRIKKRFKATNIRFGGAAVRGSY